LESDRVSDGEAPATWRRLSGEDAVFVYSETPSMPMHTMGTVIIDPTTVTGGFGFEQIAATVAARIHRMPPFRQRLLEIPLGLGHPVLVDDPDFRVENHLHHLALPAPGGMRELAEVVGYLASRPLERHQPLWEMWVLDGLVGRRVALVTKLHHCMMDGASGSNQMAGLMDLEPTPVVESAPPWKPAPLPSWLSLAARSAGSRLVNPVRLGQLVFDTLNGMRRRGRVEHSLDEAEGDASLADRPIPETPFNHALTPRRSVAYGSVSLDAVKRVKNAFGVTVNDAVLAAGTLALRRYLLSRDALPEEPLVCAVPISLKNAAEKRQFSNKVSTFAVRLPTHLDDPRAVVHAVHRQTARAKQLHQAADGGVLPDWLELVPPLLTHYLMQLVSDFDLAELSKPLWNVLISNMQGPPMPLYFGGARVEAVYPMGPVGEGMGLNITLLSNMGRIDIGVLSCSEIVPDPAEIAEGFDAALAELERSFAPSARPRPFRAVPG
jgi:WS/DGAT/MGAT family acyltransferase